MTDFTNREIRKNDRENRDRLSPLDPPQANANHRNQLIEKSVESPEQRLQASDQGGILREVDIDQVDMNMITSDDSDDNFDVDEDGIDNEPNLGITHEASSEMAQSYGTGLQGQPTDRSGRRAHFSRTSDFNQATPDLTGGDVDANYEQASVVGDEAVGGTAPTPDQNVVEDLGVAVGLELDDRTFMRTQDILEERDERRWELDPESSEDYDEHHA